MAGFETMLAAQTFTTLHSFSALQGGTNADGQAPQGALALSDGALYGTATSGGSFINGTVFSINLDGTGFRTVHHFAYDEGESAEGGLIVSSNTLYGTAGWGGAASDGTVFKLNTDGTGFRVLHTFGQTFGTFATNADGAHPHSTLVLSGNTLYGTAGAGGKWGYGTIFALSTDGTGFTNLHDFGRLIFSGLFPAGTNTDGAQPQAGLALSGTTLSGTTLSGGFFGAGTIFRINTDSTAFTNAHNFSATDGDEPETGLVAATNRLYGTASGGGYYLGPGDVFAVFVDGTGFTNLHDFTPLTQSTNSDGFWPRSTPILAQETLYGTTYRGGGSGWGTVFRMRCDGSGFRTLHDFSSYSPPDWTNCDGAEPIGALTLYQNTLYGTATTGGVYGGGTVFSIFVPPELTINASGSNIILQWPTNATGFFLQSTTNLVSPVWTANLAPPVMVNGQNTVTNAVSGTSQFYRLSR